MVIGCQPVSVPFSYALKGKCRFTENITEDRFTENITEDRFTENITEDIDRERETIVSGSSKRLTFVIRMCGDQV